MKISKDDLTIFICAHKPFNCIKTEPYYKIITSKGVTIPNTKLEVLYEDGVDEVTNMQRAYGEFSRMYYVAKKLKDTLPKYVGICHYRRYYRLDNLNLTMDDIFKNHDVIVRQGDDFQMHGSVLTGYNTSHNLDDLLEVLDIAQKKYDIPLQTILSYCAGKLVPGNNMVILPKEEFIKYVDWLYSIISIFNDRHGMKTDEDVLRYVSTKFNTKQEYQARLQGFLIERLTALYVKLYCKNPFIVNREDYTTIQEKTKVRLQMQ